LKIDRKVIDNLDEPSLWITLRVELDECDYERLLDDVASIFFLEAMLPSCATDKGKEIASVELVKAGRIRQERS